MTIHRFLRRLTSFQGTIPSDQVFADSKACAEWLRSNAGEDSAKALESQLKG